MKPRRKYRIKVQCGSTGLWYPVDERIYSDHGRALLRKAILQDLNPESVFRVFFIGRR